MIGAVADRTVFDIEDVVEDIESAGVVSDSENDGVLAEFVWIRDVPGASGG